MNIFKKSFVIISILFVLGFTLVFTNKADATILVSVTPDNLSVLSGGHTRIRWNAPTATSCTPPAGYESAGTGNSGSFDTGPLYANKTFNVSCSNVGYAVSAYTHQSSHLGICGTRITVYTNLSVSSITPGMFLWENQALTTPFADGAIMSGNKSTVYQVVNGSSTNTRQVSSSTLSPC